MALAIATLANFVRMDVTNGGKCTDPEGCTPDPRIKEQFDAGKYDDMFYDDGK